MYGSVRSLCCHLLTAGPDWHFKGSQLCTASSINKFFILENQVHIHINTDITKYRD